MIEFVKGLLGLKEQDEFERKNGVSQKEREIALDYKKSMEEKEGTSLYNVGDVVIRRMHGKYEILEVQNYQYSTIGKRNIPVFYKRFRYPEGLFPYTYDSEDEAIEAYKKYTSPTIILDNIQ